MSDARVVGRLAPSPNGALHLGHATSLLGAWWSARSRGGRIVLRLEDVDVDRAGQDYIDRALQDMMWLGMNWDGEPLIQSTRISPMVDAAERLLAARLAYPCTCSRKELALAAAREETVGAPQLGVLEVRYPGTCREKGFASISEAEHAEGKEAGIRLRVSDGRVTFQDELFGPQSHDVAAEVGDFLILRRNKLPAYQLAVVVDDDLDGVTEVVRGRDLLSSTARQMLLSSALGLERPVTLHLPLVLDSTGRRLSKREKALGLVELRERGLAPEQVVGWAAHRLGLIQIPRRGLAEDFVADFQIDRLTRNDIVLPENEQEWFAGLT